MLIISNTFPFYSIRFYIASLCHHSASRALNRLYAASAEGAHHARFQKLVRVKVAHHLSAHHQYRVSRAVLPGASCRPCLSIRYDLTSHRFVIALPHERRLIDFMLHLQKGHTMPTFSSSCASKLHSMCPHTINIESRAPYSPEHHVDSQFQMFIFTNTSPL